MKIAAACIGTLVLALASPASAQGRLNVYCSVQAEWCTPAATEFQQPTGIQVAMTQRRGRDVRPAQRRGANPKGDVWFGGTGDPHLQAAEESLTEAYSRRTRLAAATGRSGRPSDSGDKTVGIYAGALGFGYNTELLAKKIAGAGLLGRPAEARFKARSRWPIPNSSGTAYIAIATIVQLMGEDKAFDYLTKLNQNIDQYTSPGHRAHEGGGSRRDHGQRSASCMTLTDALPASAVKVVAPCEGTGYEIGSMSMIKGARNPANAKKFYEWALTPEAQVLAAQAKQLQLPSNTATPVPPEAPDMPK